jgi:hypothetical protein
MGATNSFRQGFGYLGAGPGVGHVDPCRAVRRERLAG